MKKIFIKYIVCWIVLLLLFNFVCFLTPSKLGGYLKFDSSFWIGYIFITFAFIGQLVCAYIAFRAENIKKLFYNLPLITINYSGLILVLICGSVTMVIPNLPEWVGGIVCLLILGLNTVSVIKASAAADLVEKVEEKNNTKNLFIKNLAIEAKNLIYRANNEEIREECRKVYEEIRYSDPINHTDLKDIEAMISAEMGEFLDAVIADDVEIARSIAESLIATIRNRNEKNK